MISLFDIWCKHMYVCTCVCMCFCLHIPVWIRVSLDFLALSFIYSDTNLISVFDFKSIIYGFLKKKKLIVYFLFLSNVLSSIHFSSRVHACVQNSYIEKKIMEILREVISIAFQFEFFFRSVWLWTHLFITPIKFFIPASHMHTYL